MTEIEPLELRARRISGIISTDDILPARYKHASTDPNVLARHVFENLLPGFAQSLSAGDVLVADQLFGVGSSREQAVTALLAAGVRAVIAPAFGRIFFRNAWNCGLVAVEVKGAFATEGERLELSLSGGSVRGAGAHVSFPPLPREILEMHRAGGLLRWLRQQGATHRRESTVPA